MADHIVYSEQAKILLENMPDFPKEAFEKYWEERMFSVGSNNILEFLIHMRRSADINASAKK
jgi:hypothetical protein